MATNVVALWKGSIATIPSGSFLCDGSNSTPDLRNYFVACAGSTYGFGSSGGSNTKSIAAHTHSIASHTHTVGTGALGATSDITVAGGTGSSPYSAANHTHTLTVTIGSNTGSLDADSGYSGLENRPVFYALAYILTLGDFLPSGSIGLIHTSVPSGWQLCNGTSGTPDLRDRWVLCKNLISDSSATGGLATSTYPAHTHTQTHSHVFSGTADAYTLSGYQEVITGSGKNYANLTHTHPLTGTSATNGTASTSTTPTGVSNLPVYKALYYIMKL